MKQPKNYKTAAAKQGKDSEKRKEGAKWLDRIKAAGKLEKPWMDDAAKAVNAYTNSNKNEMDRADVLGSRYDFNILYANVETIVPAVINSPPVPDIRRRFNDPDPAARVVADLMERAIRVQIDDSRMQIELEGAAQDAFLAGRGIIRIRFKSNIVGTKDEPTDDEIIEAESSRADGEGEPDAVADAYSSYDQSGDAQTPVSGVPSERIEDECIPVEAVAWNDYRHGPATRWADRPWDAFRFCIAREDEAESFDTKLIDSQLDDTEKNARRISENDLTGWEIWCKKDRKVKFIDDDGIILKEIDDPLGLPDFFCIPTPMQPIELVGNLRPYNPFNIYSKLADELDTITKRINIIVEAMQVKGWYPGEAKDILNIISLADNEFAPVAGAELWAQHGGIDGIVAFWPIEKFAACLKELYLAREQTKQSIYEITGISDIVRGASQASETATAQNIKSQWGSLRIQKMQRMLERCARDIFVMMSEIIPTKFSRETLEKMTGIPLLPKPGMDPEQIQQIQAVNALLDQRISTYYRVDVESDSTVRADLTRQKQEASEFLQGSGAYFQGVMPLVETGAMSKEVAIELYASNARMFNLGKSTEDVLEKWSAEARQQAAQPQEEKPDPEMVKAQTEQQKAMAGAQSEQAKLQMQMESQQQEMALKAQAAQITMQMDQRKQEFELQDKIAQAQIKLRDSEAARSVLMAKAQSEQRAHELDMEKKLLEIEKIKAEIEKINVTTVATVDTANAKTQEADDAKAKDTAKEDSTAALTQVLKDFTAAMHAPKTIVRDPKTGKAMGVQTVQQNG